MNNPWMKVAIFGAITAIVVDHMFKPTLRKTMGM
jgi:hypothetical protein